MARASTHRPTRSSRTGWSRAVGAPSGSLQRAAVLERVFISKDFRRLGLVVAVALDARSHGAMRGFRAASLAWSGAVTLRHLEAQA